MEEKHSTENGGRAESRNGGRRVTAFYIEALIRAEEQKSGAPDSGGASGGEWRGGSGVVGEHRGSAGASGGKRKRRDFRAGHRGWKFPAAVL